MKMPSIFETLLLYILISCSIGPAEHTGTSSFTRTRALSVHTLVKRPFVGKRRTLKLCRTCYSLGIRKQTSWICPACRNSPGLCSTTCFTEYHHQRNIFIYHVDF